MEFLFPDALPLTCDCCTHAIHKPEQGVLLWIRDNNTGEAVKLFLVHGPGERSDCLVAASHGEGADPTPLWEVVGIGGLIFLCERLKAEPVSAPAIAEIILRIFIPGYDRLRFLRGNSSPNT